MTRRTAFVSVALFLAACDGRPTERPRGVLLVILDTTRADHLSCYGYERPTTPNLDRLAAEGERFEQAWSQSPWTLPAMATILTGQPPHVHGAELNREGLFPLRANVRTLAERLATKGWRRAAFVNVVWCHPNSGLGRGFDPYDFRAGDDNNRQPRDAAATTDAALAWLAGVRGAPFFLVVHYFDPHLTYDPPPPWDTRFEPRLEGAVGRGFGSKSDVFKIREGRVPLDERARASLIARYDGELGFTDEQFGRLRAGLERLGRWDGTLVAVTADHGEEFWDHGGFEHGHSHHTELLHVPLIVRRPGGPSGAVHAGRVRLLDLAPTILSWAGVSLPVELPGHVLGPTGADHSVAQGTLWAGDLVSVRAGEGTLIVNRDTGQHLYYAPGDRGEQLPLEPDAAARALDRLLGALPPPRQRDGDAWEPDPEQLEQLRSLGYAR